MIVIGLAAINDMHEYSNEMCIGQASNLCRTLE